MHLVREDRWLKSSRSAWFAGRACSATVRILSLGMTPCAASTGMSAMAESCDCPHCNPHNHLTLEVKRDGSCPACGPAEPVELPESLSALFPGLVPLVPVDTAERLPDGRTVIRPSDSPCRKHGIRSCPKCGR